jgi:hypothetical protein
MGEEIVKLVDENKTKDRKVSFPCVGCQRRTLHIVMQSVDCHEQLLEDGYHVTIQSWQKYQIVQCLGCEEISFRLSTRCSEDFVTDPISGETVLEEKVECYPSRIVGRKKLEYGLNLPAQVSAIYDETHAALCNKQPILAGIGIRALLETICKEKGAEGRDLKIKINALVEMKVLTQPSADILQRLRTLGNEAAHEVKPHSEDRLGVAMDIIEHLLKDVYILPKIANSLPEAK